MTTTDPAFTCTRWRRFGHDRLYVSTAGGVQLGYRDLTTGLDQPGAEPDRALLTALADAHGAEPPRPTPAPVPAAELAAVTRRDPAWTALRATGPGAPRGSSPRWSARRSRCTGSW